jgi:hypothetical protein
MEFTKCTIWGKTLFIYITKSIYIGSASLKTLPLDLEPPLQGKEYGSPYCNEIAKKKANVFVPKITYRFVTRILFFWNVNLQKRKCLKINLSNSGILKGSTFSGCQHSTNTVIFRQFALANEKPLASLFPLLCTALPKIHEVSQGFPSSSLFSRTNCHLDVLSNHFFVFPCFSFLLIFLDVLSSFKNC